MTVHIYNPELFTERGQYIIQWLERRSDNTWKRRRGVVNARVAHRLLRMDPFDQLQWIAKRIDNSIPETPEPVEDRTRMTPKDYR